MDSDIYLGIKSHIVSIERESGRERWRTKIKRGALTTLVVDGDLVITYSGGHLFALRRNDGQIVWENGLPGLGHSYCLIASEGGQGTAAAAAMQQAQAASQTAAAGAAAGAAASSS